MKTSPSHSPSLKATAKRLGTLGVLASTLALASCDRVSDVLGVRDGKVAIGKHFPNDYDGNSNGDSTDVENQQEQTEATKKLLKNLHRVSQLPRAGEKLSLEAQAFRNVYDFVEEKSKDNRIYRDTIDPTKNPSTHVDYTLLAKNGVLTISWGGNATIDGKPVRGTVNFKESRKESILQSEDGKTWKDDSLDDFQGTLKSLSIK